MNDGSNRGRDVSFEINGRVDCQSLTAALFIVRHLERPGVAGRFSGAGCWFASKLCLSER